MNSDNANWICGLMAENYEALGFIPSPSVKHRYVGKNQYILQTDERGRRIGYLLHGPIKYGQAVTITQHCIQYEKRLAGYGRLTFLELKRRCEIIGCSSIRLRVAEDLQSVNFWKSVGFVPVDISPGGRSRNRMIISMIYYLELPLFLLSRGDK